MNQNQSSRRAGAFTLIEMLCVMAIIGILAALLLPALSQGKRRAMRVQCLNNLKEVGVAFHAFMHDHDGRFPMQISTNDGGSLEFVQQGNEVNGEFDFGFRHWQTLSNELVSPKLLNCPADLREPAANFAALQNENVSYFVGVNADYSRPVSILAGDRNITNGSPVAASLIRATAASNVWWTRELHAFKGNLLFADAHVEQSKDFRLSLPTAQPAESDLVLPSVRSIAVASLPTADPAPSVVAQSRPPVSGFYAPLVLLAFSVTNSPAAPARLTNTVTPAVNAKALNQAKSPKAAADNSGMSAFDRRFVETTQGFIKSTGLFLYLLLLLLILALICRRVYREMREKRRRLARLQVTAPE